MVLRCRCLSLRDFTKNQILVVCQKCSPWTTLRAQPRKSVLDERGKNNKEVCFQLDHANCNTSYHRDTKARESWKDPMTHWMIGSLSFSPSSTRLHKTSRLMCSQIRVLRPSEVRFWLRIKNIDPCTHRHKLL